MTDLITPKEAAAVYREITGGNISAAKVKNLLVSLEAGRRHLASYGCKPDRPGAKLHFEGIRATRWRNYVGGRFALTGSRDPLVIFSISGPGDGL